MKPPRTSDAPAVRLEVENEWAWCGEKRLPLMPRAYAVLRHLVDHAGRLITKEELLAEVWRDAIVSDAALTSCIRDLRRALGDSSQAPRYIETVHRRGFRFIGPIARPSPSALARPASEAKGEQTSPPVAPPLVIGPSAPPDLAGAGSTARIEPARSRPMLVGREAELARLRARYEAAAAGRRQLVFVTGEAGIGKTALVEALLWELGSRAGVRMGRGQCVEQFGAGEAYLPLLDALGRLGRQAGGDAVVATLNRHAPAWLAHLPGLLGDEDLASVRRRAEGTTQERSLLELIEAFEILGAGAPFVLVLEDLHWSDSATIELLTMLARRRDAARLLIVATYRPADVVAAAHPLRAAAQELNCTASPRSWSWISSRRKRSATTSPDAFRTRRSLRAWRRTGSSGSRPTASGSSPRRVVWRSRAGRTTGTQSWSDWRAR